MDWCILRCSGASTLPLARSLGEAGFEVFSPAMRKVDREEACRTRREVQAPMMPGYVLAAADRLSDLLALSHTPAMIYRVWDSERRCMVAKGIPYFTVFRGGQHRLIPDDDVKFLRRAERRERPAAEAERTFVVGQRVRTDDGAWTGLPGVVVAVKRKTVLVQFPNWPTTPEFPGWMLTPELDEAAKVHVTNDQASSAKAA